MKISTFEKKLLEKAKLLYNEGFKKDKHFITCSYDTMPSLTNKKIRATLFAYKENPERERDFEAETFYGNTIKEIFGKINEKIDGLKRGEQIELE